jgi:hypothetical protein
MGQFDFYSAIKDFGFPVALAALLVVYFLRQNGALTRANERLLNELGLLREALAKQAKHIEEQTKLIDQNEKLVDAIRLREAESFKLVERYLEAGLESSRQKKADAND